MKTLRDEIRAKYPTRAARASRSAKSAIRLFCIECFGGDAGDARRCQERDCFLWPHVKVWRDSVGDAASSDDVGVDSSLGEAASAVSGVATDGETEGTSPPAVRRPPPSFARVKKEQGPPLDRAPGALVGRTLRHVDAGGAKECAVTGRGFEYGGAVYSSISAAAKVASGRKAVNGWEYWR